MDFAKFDFILSVTGLSVMKLVVPETKLFSHKRKIVEKRAKAYPSGTKANRRGTRGK